MSALASTNTTLFGAGGVSDPSVFKTGVGISRTIDFGAANMVAASGDSENFEFIALPASFILKGLYIEEVEGCDAEVSITAKLKTAGSTVGNAVTVGDTLPLKSVQSVTHTPLANGDVLCLCIAGGASGVEGRPEGQRHRRPSRRRFSGELRGHRPLPHERSGRWRQRLQGRSPDAVG